MKKVLTLVTAAAALASVQPVQADPIEGFYIGGFGGANWLQTDRRHGRKFDFNTGYAAGGTLGYEWCGGFRTEFEAAYRFNSVRRVKFRGETGESSHRSRRGRLRDMSYLANLVYEIPMCWNPCSWYGWELQPYVGAGLGYSYQRISSGRRSSSEGADTFRHSRKRKGVAWQIIVGIGYDFCECIELALEYKFHQGREARFYDHTLDAAVRYHF